MLAARRNDAQAQRTISFFGHTVPSGLDYTLAVFRPTEVEPMRVTASLLT